MARFELNKDINPNKVFILNRSEIEKRLDPLYYVPVIKELEKKVRIKDVKPLREYVVSVSSGATPKTEEKEKYYSDKEKGIPFLRVQNLSPTGVLDYSNCKYINKKTHENYLKRSQVNGGDLLVKITGVGRMAVASVAPDGFIGNTNQHMVVIKTENKEVSKVLASYLNSDIGEKLASRRATGATRPALDYPALLSIPIYFDSSILDIGNEAVKKKNEKQTEAKTLLASIDDYLLSELGIKLPERDDSLNNRIFTINSSKIFGYRLDPEMVLYRQIVSNSTYSTIPLGHLLKKNPQYGANEIGIERTDNSSPRYIRITDIDNYGFLKAELGKTASTIEDRYILNDDDILLARSGNTVGKSYIHKTSMVNYPCFFAGYMIRFIANDERLLPNFLFVYTQSGAYKNWVKAIQRTAGQPNINAEEYKSLEIPIPPLEKQNEIIDHVEAIREKAKQLEKDADELMEQAKLEVEQIILGE